MAGGCIALLAAFRGEGSLLRLLPSRRLSLTWRFFLFLIPFVLFSGRRHRHTPAAPRRVHAPPRLKLGTFRDGRELVEACATLEEILKSHKCIRDPNGLLTDFAGLRVSPGTRAAADGVVYINVYSTDKTIHYQLHQGVFQKHSPKDLLPGNISGVLKRLDRWTSCLNECMGGKDDHRQQEAAARCEVRVCLNDYSRVLVDWNVRDVNQFVSAVPARSWW